MPRRLSAKHRISVSLALAITKIIVQPMNSMSEILSGEGFLEEWNNPDASYAVEYRFVISDTHNGGLGRIIAATPFPLVSGIYRLQTQDGAAIKVRHGGSGIWTILRR